MSSIVTIVGSDQLVAFGYPMLSGLSRELGPQPLALFIVSPRVFLSVILDPFLVVVVIPTLKYGRRIIPGLSVRVKNIVSHQPSAIIRLPSNRNDLSNRVMLISSYVNHFVVPEEF
jgi:hypothetical protein